MHLAVALGEDYVLHPMKSPQYRRLGGETNREIVSFRVVRACVRARGAVCKVGFGKKRYPRALSLFPFGLAAFSLFPVEKLGS